MSGPEHLHTVAITGDEDDPRIEFTCSGTRKSQCHSYPDCDCDVYSLGAKSDDAGHPFIAHDACWLQAWFDNGNVAPSPEDLTDRDFYDDDIRPGMTGPIAVEFADDCVDWEFMNAPLLRALSHLAERDDRA